MEEEEGSARYEWRFPAGNDVRGVRSKKQTNIKVQTVFHTAPRDGKTCLVVRRWWWREEEEGKCLDWCTLHMMAREQQPLFLTQSLNGAPWPLLLSFSVFVRVRKGVALGFGRTIRLQLHFRLSMCPCACVLFRCACTHTVACAHVHQTKVRRCVKRSGFSFF
jgi:hypothetical protein